MLKDFFFKQKRFATIPSEHAKKDIPEGRVKKCEHCGTITFVKELEKNLYVCSTCDYHFALSAPERIKMIMDQGHFFEYDSDLISSDPLKFEGYTEKLKSDMRKSNLNEAVVTGEGTIGGFPVVIGVMDTRFRMGSMGAVVGEKIARAIERAVIKRYPFIMFSASGGARMQEGIISLMQMAKTSAALAKLHQEGILFISVLTNPTTGGVSASFASLGDINIAEPGALIGFAGPRVIEQIIRQKLPEGFQTSEFLLEHGQLDLIVHRKDLKATLNQLLDLHMVKGRM
ncbi:acetyl-CoA carboxylase, carboxyltransferase subunit beta [Tepidibacillus fermentans]|uniref:Acetyl-coenzyme A carboxylase carboxyl transferase subunit beta n=1 Tax=Tepidibacillus fermentans TaxID=1281767 RepID=A0A4R3KJN2_9BACI|nr:acetyl-CoA carboxylase, carboxyltransferase subunit beta [Tepidibacillus fermentans]TCS83584.1 acetyl-CoA carboxylase carboxyl transferase subunit beta [Tepidibacillus fermentans]